MPLSGGSRLSTSRRVSTEPGDLIRIKYNLKEKRERDFADCGDAIGPSLARKGGGHQKRSKRAEVEGRIVMVKRTGRR